MRTIQSFIYSCILVSLSSLIVSAQQNTVATGGEASGSGGHVSYTVGQIDYQMHNDNDGTVSEGVQQPYEIYIMTDVDDQQIQLKANVFPNPVMDRLTLNIDQVLLQNLHYTILNNKGQVLYQRKISSPSEEIRVSEFPQGLYFLNVNSGQELLKSFKIIKKR